MWSFTCDTTICWLVASVTRVKPVVLLAKYEATFSKVFSINYPLLSHRSVTCAAFSALTAAPEQAQLRAASALRGLSVDEDLRTEIVARGGLVPLLRLSSSDDIEVQMEVGHQLGLETSKGDSHEHRSVSARTLI